MDLSRSTSGRRPSRGEAGAEGASAGPGPARCDGAAAAGPHQALAAADGRPGGTPTRTGSSRPPASTTNTGRSARRGRGFA